MWEITDTERYRWQIAAINRLSTLVHIGAEKGYPALTWTVDPTGALTGMVTGRDADRRATWELWASEIEAYRRTETPAPGGITRLYAAVTTTRGGASTIAITATVFPPDDSDAETGSDAR